MPSHSRRIVIVHGFKAGPESDWYRNVAAHLRKSGHSVIVPKLPLPLLPGLERWADAIAIAVAQAEWEVDDRLCLIGHGAGCLAAMRFAERLEAGSRLRAMVLVAPFPAVFLRPWLKTFVTREPKLEPVRSACDRILTVFSKNDWRVPIERNKRWCVDNLGATELVVQKAGHFMARDGWNDWSLSLLREVARFIG